MGILYCDGERFRRAFLAGASWLSENKEILNQLNVFPVPDGDTGTNMSLTVSAAVKELSDMENASLEEVLEAAARGTLMGARGCSGVIFSQLIAGFAEAGRGKTRFYSQDMAVALKLGSERAYRAVTKPVEGTILTVIRETAEEAARAAKENVDFTELLEIALNQAKISLENTPNLLDRLAQAGVVDSGGQGFVFVLEGILRLIKRGEGLDITPQPVASPPLGTAQAMVSESWENPYCTEFLISGTDENVPDIRNTFAKMGSDLAVVGWNELVKVHIHTPDPEKVLAQAHSYGKPINVKIDDTRKQHSHIVPAAYRTQEMESERAISIVTTAPGDGVKAICMSLGAEVVIVGDETRNPSVSELTDAINEAYSDDVLLLPNDGNIFPAATQAASMSDKQVRMIPSKNMSQGFAALVAFMPNVGIDENAEDMEMALEDVRHGEIAYAGRDAQYDDLVVRNGDVIGLFSGSVRVAEDNRKLAVIKLLKIMLDEDSEMIAILYGAEINRSEAEELLEEIESEFPDQEIEFHYGGQAYCLYLLSVE